MAEGLRIIVSSQCLPRKAYRHQPSSGPIGKVRFFKRVYVIVVDAAAVI